MEDLGKFAQNISILHRKFQKDTNDQFKEYSLNATASCILLTIYDQPGINQQKISESLVVDKALTNREINKMQKLGYLDKKSGPGKSLQVYLTSEGDEIAPALQKIRSTWWERQFIENDLDEDSKLVASIDKVVNHIVND